MLFSFLSMSPSAQLKLRRRKAQVERVRKRDLKLHAEERIRRYEAAMPIEHFLEGIVRDCVVSACAVVADGMSLEEEKYGASEGAYSVKSVISNLWKCIY